MSEEYTLKKLRALCLDIHDEQTAILLRSCFAEFPIPVINEFFNGPKLNKPSNPDEREWTDLVRLFFIALAPEGSDPAKLRGTRFGRYVREYPYNPDRNDSNDPGVLTLYPTFKSSLLLKDIASGLGITALGIRSELWLECYLNDPFPVRSLGIYIEQNEWRGWKPLPIPLRCLEEDFSAAVELLPEKLERLSLSFGTMKKVPTLLGSSIARLTALSSLKLEIDSLPEGIDFAKNTQLESIGLEIKKGGPKPITGIGGLKNLKSLEIESEERISLKSIAPLFNKGIDTISLSGVDYLDTEMSGECPKYFVLGSVSGLKKMTLKAMSKDSSSLDIGTFRGSPIDLENIDVSGEISRFEVEKCPKLKNLKSHIESSCQAFKISDSESLSKIDAVFEGKIDELELVNLPALSETKLEAPSGCEGGETSSKCKFVKIGSKRLPSFKGAWKDLSNIEISDCRNLESLAGLHLLPDLRVAQLKKLPALRDLFPQGTPRLPSLTHLMADGLCVQQAPAGFESMPGLTHLQWHDCYLESMAGAETLRSLESVDLSGSNLRSLAPFASLPLLKSIKVSQCHSIKPKPPRVLLEGVLLVNELSRATGGKITTGAREEFMKVVELLSAGNVDDIKQAVHFIPLLTNEERELLLTGATIAPETGWIRLPFLTKVKEDESQGILQFHILSALREVEPSAARILDSVDTIALNPRSDQNRSALCFGSVVSDYASKNDKVLEEFPSLAALPALKQITTIKIKNLSRFSLEGIANFPKLEKLVVLGVDKIENIGALGGHAHLKNLELSKPDVFDFQEIGSLPSLDSLYIEQEFKSLRGIENFPALTQLRTLSIQDISDLFIFSKNRGKTLSFKGAFGSDHSTSWGVRFEFV